MPHAAAQNHVRVDTHGRANAWAWYVEGLHEQAAPVEASAKGSMAFVRLTNTGQVLLAGLPRMFVSHVLASAG